MTDASATAAPPTVVLATRPRWRPGHFEVALAVICAAALALRVAFIVGWFAKVPLVADPWHFYWQGRFVASGKGFLSPYALFQLHVHAPSAYHPPAFVVLLAPLDAVGIHAVRSQLLLNACIGTASVALVGVLARRLASARAGIVAAVIAAAYPNLWINDVMLLAESTFICAVLAAVLLAYRARERATWVNVCGCAAACTVAGLARSEALLLLPLLVLPVIVRAGRIAGARRGARLLAGAVGVAVVLLGPWFAYNATRFTKPVLVSTNDGPTLAVGNCPLTYSGSLLGYWTPQCGLPPYLTPVPGDESVVSAHDRSVALSFVSDHLSELPKVLLAREGRLWGVYRVHQQVALDRVVEGRTASHGPAILWWADAMYWALLLPAAAGIVVLRRRGRAVYPLVLPLVLAALVAAASFGLTRYRCAADACLVVLAACGIDLAWRAGARALTRRGHPGRDSRVGAGPTLAAAATVEHHHEGRELGLPTTAPPFAPTDPASRPS